MKKAAAFILLLIYFTVSTGFVISVHYCMNQVDGVELELGNTHSHQCGKCGMELKKSGGCCKEDIKLVKLKADQSAVKMPVADFSISVPFTTTSHFLLCPFQNTLYPDDPVAHGPPPDEQGSYLKNCVFRI